MTPHPGKRMAAGFAPINLPQTRRLGCQTGHKKPPQ